MISRLGRSAIWPFFYGNIHAGDSPGAARWFNGLEALLYQRILYKVNAESQTVTVLHIRHGRQRPFASETLARDPESSGK